MKKNRIYKVEASYFIRAKDEEEALEIVANDTDFIENHVLITPATEKESLEIEFGSTETYN